ncbi:MAG: helix-turn-helix transcriptional regulator [Micrococcales bacterium]|nr:helix-turn-helix transcriptional regulator [Micrococcales bacterium]
MGVTSPTAESLVVPCCPPITTSELSAEQAESAAVMFKALADPVRLRLMSKVAAAEGGEACVCDLLDVGVAQPTVSHHLKKLREAGLLTSRKQGTWVYYAVAPGALTSMAAILDASR